MREKHKSDLIAVESVGVGEGIVSRLRELYPDQPHIVLPVNPGMASNYPEQFKNLRAEMWWKAAELLRDGLVSIPNDPILVEQLSTPKYSIKSDRVVAIEDKEEIKKRLGRSPDRADALIQGLYALRFTPNALAHIRLEKVRARRWSGDEVYDEHVGDLI